MKRAVYKYPLVLDGQLSIDDQLTIVMPKGAVLLSVAVQRDQPCVWALVDPSAPNVKHRVRVAGTGHDLEGEMFTKYTFVGTFLLRGGSLVFHVFDLGEGKS